MPRCVCQEANTWDCIYKKFPRSMGFGDSPNRQHLLGFPLFPPLPKTR